MNPFSHMLSVTELHVPVSMQHDALSLAVDTTSHVDEAHVANALSFLYTDPTPHSLSDTAVFPAAAPFLSPQVASATQQAALSASTFISHAPPVHGDMVLAALAMNPSPHSALETTVRVAAAPLSVFALPHVAFVLHTRPILPLPTP